MTTMNLFIKVPIKIITKKIAQNKQNSIFYAGKNIAEVKVRDRTYVLTTAGQYVFSLKEGDLIHFDSSSERRTPGNAISRLTDTKIKSIDQNGLVSNWGWFGINVWHNDVNLELYPTETYSSYDEALKAFIAFVEKDLSKS